MKVRCSKIKKIMIKLIGIMYELVVIKLLYEYAFISVKEDILLSIQNIKDFWKSIF